MRNLSIVKKKFFDYVDHIIENNKVSHAYLVEVNNYEDDDSYLDPSKPIDILEHNCKDLMESTYGRKKPTIIFVQNYHIFLKP